MLRLLSRWDQGGPPHNCLICQAFADDSFYVQVPIWLPILPAWLTHRIRPKDDSISVRFLYVHLSRTGGR